MRAILLGLLAVSAVAIATPAFAQVTVDTPVGGVRVGPDHYRDRDYDRYHHRGYGSYARDCRTITIRRDDGSVRRIRRCD